MEDRDHAIRQGRIARRLAGGRWKGAWLLGRNAMRQACGKEGAWLQGSRGTIRRLVVRQIGAGADDGTAMATRQWLQGRGILQRGRWGLGLKVEEGMAAGLERSAAPCGEADVDSAWA